MRPKSGPHGQQGFDLRRPQFARFTYLSPIVCTIYVWSKHTTTSAYHTKPDNYPTKGVIVRTKWKREQKIQYCEQGRDRRGRAELAASAARWSPFVRSACPMFSYRTGVLSLVVLS